MTSHEKSPPSIVNLLDEVFYGRDFNVSEAHAHEPSIGEIRLLSAGFPLSVENQDLHYALAKDRSHPSGLLGRMAIKLLSLNESKIKFSPVFNTYRRSIYGRLRGESPWIRISVEDIRLEGRITVNGAGYEFSKDNPIIRAGSAWLNEGMAPEHAINYTYVPHLHNLFSNVPQDKIDPSIQFVDKRAPMLVNLRSILEAAYRITER